MKKHKLLVAALAVAVMLMGAGYAYWTQTITIANTVSTGYLDVQFVDADESDWDDGYIAHISDDLVTVDSVIATDKQNLSFTVGNFYPGAGAYLSFVVKNSGTVPAKVTSVTGSITENADLANALNYKFDAVVIRTLNAGFWSYRYEDIDAIDANNVSDLATGLTSALQNIVLQPGEELMLTTHNFIFNETQDPGYQVLMPSAITGSQFEDTTTKFDLAIAFTQVN
ncbi:MULTISPECIES: hypothetical protein [unclassified Dehalobacter]|uniref:hypothetical protein n=1 Tax=unclassified Dehalobacter TaxID=2635733 RepID=UPI000E6D48FE|nr:MULTISPECIES: hypothetical protein [unclassified Dehalobacter]RJE49096.1 hypothetical protein A7K50_13445 [Dehalobacter sp. MCB1]TCX47210.1 hypothetical protein C1I36_14560 [Dehalobacter sp. 14DCB1]TCX55330.1 hypothetical protein C1I38_03205 [Dehalobacter sp. 12DCB1]